jgi:hypothetical protein
MSGKKKFKKTKEGSTEAFLDYNLQKAICPRFF